jgi:hypothetical protein
VIGLTEILHGYDFYRRRVGEAPPALVPAVRAGLVFAREIARGERDEPAALFFVFAVQRHAFGTAWKFMAKAIAVKHAAALGMVLDLPEGDPNVQLYLERTSSFAFEDVRAFIEDRLSPRGA